MKKLILSLIVLCSLTLTAQNVVFNDANFKTALLNHSPAIDTSNDGEISIAEANFMNHGVSVANKNISDLTGLEHFINIPEFYCNGNSISTISISTMAALTSLTCSDNTINSIDITQNPGLLRLSIGNNSLTSLDASKNTSMVLLSCFSNNMTTIDVRNGNNTNMQFSGTGNPNACIAVDDVGYSQNAWNWSEDTSVTYTLTCSTTDIKEEQGVVFSFYPNPVVNQLNIISSSFLRLEITDLSGKKVLTSYQPVTNLNALKKGVYFLTVYDLKGNFNTERLIKQ